MIDTDSERQWKEWWGALPVDQRKKIESYESSIGTRLTWNDRYMIQRNERNWS